MGGTSMAMAILVGRGPAAAARRGALATPPRSRRAASDLAVVLAMAYLALVPSALAQVLILISTRRMPARRTSAWLLLTPLTSAFVALTLLGETPTPLELAGGALVVVGITGASGAGGGDRQGLVTPPAAVRGLTAGTRLRGHAARERRRSGSRPLSGSRRPDRFGALVRVASTRPGRDPPATRCRNRARRGSRASAARRCPCSGTRGAHSDTR